MASRNKRNTTKYTIPTDTSYLSDPIPDFVVDWGHDARRPEKLPEFYDTRIEPAHIYVFPRHPDSGQEGDFYVVSKACTHCKRLRQRCNRGRPYCDRCYSTRHPCVPHASGWDELPRPKGDRPRLAKIDGVKKVGPVPKNAEPGPSVTIGGKTLRARQGGESESASTSKSTGRPRRSDKQPLKVKKREPSPAIIPPPTRGRTSSGKQPVRVKKREPSPAIIPPAKRVRTPVTSPKRKEKLMSKDKPKPKPPPKEKAKVSEKVTLQKEKKKGKEKEKVKQERNSPEAVDVPFIIPEPTWRVVKPLLSTGHQSSGTPTVTPPAPPRIWATSKDELLQVLPELTREQNGVSWMNTETPVMFLEGEAGPNDTWNGSRIIKLEMVREYTPPSRLSMADLDARASNNSQLPIKLRYDPTTSRLVFIPTAANQPESASTSRPSVRNSQHPNMPLQQPSVSVSAASSSFVPKKEPTILSLSNFSQPSTSNHSYNRHYFDPFAPPPYSLTNPDQPSCRMSQQFATLEQTQPTLRGSGQAKVSSAVSWTKSIPGISGIADDGAFIVDDDYSDDDDSDIELLGLTEPQSFARTVPIIKSESLDTDTHHFLSHGHLRHPPTSVSAGVTFNSDQPGSKTMGKDDLPDKPPPEIEVIIGCHESKIPISMVVCRDWSLLPFALPDEYGCVFLGFFMVKSYEKSTVEKSSMARDDEPIASAQVRWSFTFEWIPGKECSPDKTILPPWWIPQNDISSQPAPDSEDAQRFSLLPDHLIVNNDGKIGTVAEVGMRKGWYCPRCGKLNVQKHLCFQKCSKCSTGNGASPVGVSYVRNPYNVAPVSFPWDRYPLIVKMFAKGEPNKYRIFCYVVKDAVYVKHFFTCNESSVQAPANILFHDIQRSVELVWQGVNTSLAAGPYFNCIIGQGHGPTARALTWGDVPKALTSARELMQRTVRENGEANFTVLGMTIIAWHSAGTRRSPLPIQAKSHNSLVFFCLGADIELTLIPKSGFPISSGQSPQSASAIGGPVTKREEEDVPLAVRHGPLREVASANPHSRSQNKPGEAINITMVHGDMLRLAGDEFDWSLRRTGMGILLIGM
ncbi:hypothetical protein C8Q75DRAFT_624563 [Abortiporus biennis]|nr:hypothetical protein C8Q75DRAFT_624563 [Abortiporus biennis]